MKKIFLIILLFIIVKSYSQACGSGIFKIEFYVVNEEKEKLTYEVIDLNDDNLNVLMSDNKIESIYNGIIINTELINELNLSKSTSEQLPFKNILERRGTISKGKLEFKTRELSNKISLLKIKTNKYVFYIMANLFGGCNRTTFVILGEKPILELNKM
ncbi:hypothetical protein [Flavobacterium hercynium]|uniref:Uncharacterized protein n=1 Tax=Flavobacterium hercynium TaxID=387094 RepID=A0A226HJ39_9FLAO|nr:hypothetical protein [Flavobacterium hercynium]OXA93480.1 hypothetical protein B0A66_06525 [Flavobacterium hercynium]SMP31905.1 hypothetical protein SAMN06265346_11491 [Flavobacterium hercynium]